MYEQIPICTNKSRSVPTNLDLYEQIPICTNKSRSVPTNLDLYRLFSSSQRREEWDAAYKPLKTWLRCAQRVAKPAKKERAGGGVLG
ncbi:MAG: hypothetical protein KDI79_13945 [Anaerolineae bacterium]|nr:hypothetical protein [Anaerolineae bacterium]